ncbi:NAD-dependent epimerase/dehydratase family protein [Dechloromonas denitrificans]|uniref:NAD-dependent epimerase/dehydratase family protein n=1 Tax=Dechloromonas denitrificans TaxID=281362 RepID=UPI001CF81B70|nr:NAD-dependent epimerase/dehydratase family protein [Dechloromonas denitrificans]UCV02371.1 NAD-dependent epimerase/dehydratase family protein [Dechloromonas denitrificans]
MSILVTGASGFVGSRLLRTFRSEKVACIGMIRRRGGNGCVVGDLEDVASLRQACSGIKTVFHCAGYAHAFAAFGDDAGLHWRVNYEGTRNLLLAAAEAGVKRLIFLSSVKAMADAGDICANEDFPGEPETDYGLAKRAAEEIVLEAGNRHHMHVVNLRLTMVYGAGGRGNLERMGRLVRSGLFPPLPETGNHRSLVHIDDVISAMRLVANDERAAGRTYIVAGHESPSGRALFDALRTAQGLPPCRWSLPVAILRGAAHLGSGLEVLFKRRFPFDGEVLKRLLDSAWYSAERIERDLGWQPRVPLSTGLIEMLEK